MVKECKDIFLKYEVSQMCINDNMRSNWMLLREGYTTNVVLIHRLLRHASGGDGDFDSCICSILRKTRH